MQPLSDDETMWIDRCEGVIGKLLTKSTPNSRETSAESEGSTWESRFRFNISAAACGGFANSLE